MALDPVEPVGSVEPVAPPDLRRVMRHFSSSVTVVTALVDDVAHAMTATAVCSVSLDPPLVLVCVSRTSRFHEAILRAGCWGLSILAADQAGIARHFSHRGRDLATQFDPVDHRPAPYSGAPLVVGTLAWLDCRTWAVHEGGDHTIVVGEVLASSEESSQAGPLTYYQGAYDPAMTAKQDS